MLRRCRGLVPVAQQLNSTLKGLGMQESEYTDLLNREKQIEDVTTHFKPQLDLLIDLTNYGSNLIPRLYASSEQNLVDVILIGVLLKQVVSMLDGAEVLVSKAAIHTAQLEARAAYEASIYIDWILKSESENKAKCYYVSNLRIERIWALRSIEGTKEEEEFSSITAEIDLDIHKVRPGISEEGKEHLKQVDEILAQDMFREVDQEFEAIKEKDRRKREPLWYRPMNVFSIRQIAKDVSRLAEYDLFYSIGSQVTHASSYKDHVIFKKGLVTLKPIRHLEKFDYLLNYLISTILTTYIRLLNNYRPGEMTSFSKKYIDNWRDPFRTIKEVNYDVINK